MAELVTGSSCMWLDWPLNSLYFLCLLFFFPKRLKCLLSELFPFVFVHFSYLWIYAEVTWLFYSQSHIWKRLVSQLDINNSLFGEGTFTPLQYLLICSLCAYFHFIIRVGSCTGNWWIWSIASSVWTAKCNVYLFNNEFSWQCPGHYLAIDWYLCLQMVKP